jgi:DNA-binding MarR family transcriptional regulator
MQFRDEQQKRAIIPMASPKTSSQLSPPDRSGKGSRFKPGRSVGYLLRDCYRSFSRALELQIKPYGIGLGQWYFLRELWEEDGLTQGDLSSRVGMTAPTTVVAIRRMVEDGLVVRKKDEHDRRKLRISLTQEGRRLRDELLPLALEVNNIATGGFSQKEMRQFQSLVDRMKKNLFRG